MRIKVLILLDAVLPSTGTAWSQLFLVSQKLSLVEERAQLNPQCYENLILAFLNNQK